MKELLKIHADMAARLSKPGDEIKATLTNEQVTLIQALASLIHTLSGHLLDVNPLEDDNDGLTCHCWHMAIGGTGEGGELLDAIKKNVIYCKPIDRENVVEEIGDMLFYCQGLNNSYDDDEVIDGFIKNRNLITVLDYYGITIEECLKANIEKLSKRYSSGSYSNEQAQLRADKSGES